MKFVEGEKFENENCTALNRLVGTCVLLQTCPELFEISKMTPLSSQNYAILLRSKCGAESDETYCCSMQSSALPKVEQNVTKLVEVSRVEVPYAWPDPPICGSDFQDRIVGGNITQIDEFPWTVLLLFQQRSEGDELKNVVQGTYLFILSCGVFCLRWKFDLIEIRFDRFVLSFRSKQVFSFNR